MSPSSPQTPPSQFAAIVRLLRWDKPAGRLILMVPALWALVLATGGRPPLALLAIVAIGTFATSGAGCAINDLWDRDIDPQVERTRKRPLASRELSVKVAIAVTAVALLCAAALALFLNTVSFGLCVAAVPVIGLYPLAKRVFPVPQLVLAIAWGFSVLIPWSAAADPPRLDLPAWLIWAATVFWTLGFDTIYAMADREDDRRIGINSSALFFGRYAPHAIAAFFALTVLMLFNAGLALQLGFGYWIALAIATGLWVQQAWKLLRRSLSRKGYGKLFAENVIVGFVLLAGMVAGSWW